MKVAITSGGTMLDDAFDPRFGRAAYFIIFDTETESWECHANNQECKSLQRAGIKAAELVLQLGASAVISSHVGPKARRILYENGIKLFKSDNPKIQETIDAFRSGGLMELEAADPEGAWL